MKRITPIVALSALFLLFLAGCGTPFVADHNLAEPSASPAQAEV